MHTTSTSTHVSSELPSTSASTAAVLVVLLLTAATCTITWLALRDTKPRDRPAILRALAHLVRALVTVRPTNESRREAESMQVNTPARGEPPHGGGER